MGRREKEEGRRMGIVVKKEKAYEVQRSDWSSDVFFFQAEDGIRDVCWLLEFRRALPIWGKLPPERCSSAGVYRMGAGARSEERRVGKERSSRWSPQP